MWLWVDFNSVDGDTIWTSMKRTPSVHADELEEGQRVELRDHEGNSCWGTIMGIKGSIVYLELDWSTWIPADEEEAIPLLTTGNPLTGTLLGFSFEITERFHGPQLDLTNTKRTLLPQ
jgi:hypothetical protein